jgi:prolyl oligopeptidase
MRLFQCLSLVLWSTWALNAGAAQTEVKTPRKPVVDEYQGVKVTDNYQWLEDAKGAETHEWTARQNARTRAWLDARPIQSRLADELEDYYEEAPTHYFALSYRTGINFMLRFKPPEQQPVLIWSRSLTRLDETNIVVNPNKLDTNGTTTIDWYVPSHDGKLVAVSLSEKGSEDGTLRFFDAKDGKEHKDRVPRVQYPTAGGSVAWVADGSGVYYTRFPHKGERPPADENFFQQVYFHKLGTPHTEDRYEIGKEFPRIAEIELESSPDGKLILATVANGDGGDYFHWLRLADGAWKQLTRFEDGIKFATFSEDNALYLLSRKAAPRGKILRLALDANPLSVASATLFVPEGEAVIDGFTGTTNGVYVKELVGGPSQIRYFDLAGKFQSKVPIRGPVAIGQMLVRRGEELTFRSVSYTEPVSWQYYFPGTNPIVFGQFTNALGTNRLARTGLSARSPVEFKDIEVVREFAVSKDGTKVPLNILRKKGTKLDGNNPTILYGYGGYGSSQAPNFSASRRIWFDAGGVYAIANLRGGGEFGEDWHKAGSLTQKQNVFDDFIACAEHLIRSNYTNPKKLAIQGGSNGGLLMGAALTQRPDLFQAVAAHVGIYDMLRVELEPNGAFNVTEFGSVKDKAQFDALYAYSPYHRVKNGVSYPAVLLTTGENDGRVNPYNSKKMAARLQAATGSKRPILLRTSASAGHGMGSSLRDRIAEEADVWTFLIDQLGAKIEQWYGRSSVERGPWSGAITPTSAIVKAKLRDPGAKARLLISREPTLKRATRLPLQVAGAEGGKVVAFSLDHLLPDTEYHYGLEVDGELVRDKAGRFRTFPPAGPASFTFAFASCGETGSTNASYEMIRRHSPLFYMNDGDFHYRNIKENSVRRFRRAYDLVLKSPVQAQLYRDVPLVYMWDDHDFGGDNANRKARSHAAARATYDEYVPHYPLAAGGGDEPIYQSFAVGRVKFILTDLRSERDPADQKDDEKKSMMGAQQKEWFKRELLASNGRYPLIFWVSTVPWIGTAGTNHYRVSTNVYGYIHHMKITDDMRPPPRDNRGRGGRFGRGRDADDTDDEEANDAEQRPARDGAAVANRGGGTNRFGGRGFGGFGRRRFPFGEDHWSVFSAERKEIADFIKEHNIRGLAILHGDSHMLGADDGQYSDYATNGGVRIPVMCAGPLDQNASIKGGPYSQGVYRVKKGEGCFGLVTVTDEGGPITVRFSGRNNRDEEKISLEFSVSVASQ